MAHHYHGGRRASGVLGRRGPAPGSEEDEETMYITPLGAAKEVGRSCVILKHRVRLFVHTQARMARSGAQHGHRGHRLIDAWVRHASHRAAR